MEKEENLSPQKSIGALPPLTKDQTAKSNKIRKKKLEKLRMENNAIAIQKTWRGRQGRMKVAEKKSSSIVSSSLSQPVVDERIEITSSNDSPKCDVIPPLSPPQSKSKSQQPSQQPQSQPHLQPQNQIQSQPQSQSQSQNQMLNQPQPASQPQPVSMPVPQTQILSPPPELQNPPQPQIDVKNIQQNLPKVESSLPIRKDDHSPPVPTWPATTGDTFDELENLGAWPQLNSSDIPSLQNWVVRNKKVLIRTVTWNMCANEPPKKEEVQKLLLPLDKFHILIVGTEECERSIAKSAVNPSKKGWEAYLIDAIGSNYVPLRSHTLQAIHIMLFVHTAIRPLISEVTSAAVACGMANTLGNKGGVGISFCLGLTRLVVINSHLAANQNKTKTRNIQFHKICSEMTHLLKRNLPQRGKRDESGEKMEATAEGGLSQNKKATDSTAGQDDEEEEGDGGGDEKLDDEYHKKSDLLDQYGDRIIFMGDMNYRINGNRRMIDQLLALQMHEVLLSNDQLKISMNEKQLPLFFQEAPLNFYPTYKLDIGTNKYDTGSKQRIPSWTDRILFKPSGITCLAYDSVPDIMISDHRPVYGSFLVDFIPEPGEGVGEGEQRPVHEFTSESQVCTIM